MSDDEEGQVEGLGFGDAFDLLRPAFPDNDLVLVGGQAVSWWLLYYRERHQDLHQIENVTSKDVDFLGSRAAFHRFATAIGGQAKIEEPRALTMGIVKFKDRQGRDRIVDFLRQVSGVATERVQTTAIAVEPMPDAHPGVTIRVMHPLLCLESRVYNTGSLEKYRTPVGMRQLVAAIGCERAFIRECQDDGDLHTARKASKVVRNLARGSNGKAAALVGQVNLLDAIPAIDL